MGAALKTEQIRYVLNLYNISDREVLTPLCICSNVPETTHRFIHYCHLHEHCTHDLMRTVSLICIYVDLKQLTTVLRTDVLLFTGHISSMVTGVHMVTGLLQKQSFFLNQNDLIVNDPRIGDRYGSARPPGPSPTKFPALLIQLP